MSLLRRRRAPMRELFGLTEDEVRVLATYNGEINRGIVHTEEWCAAMRDLQRRYDEGRRTRLSTDVRMSPAAMDRIQRDWRAQ
jgi:hypothetical protein